MAWHARGLLLYAAALLLSLGGARGNLDLETPLKEAYKDQGLVTEGSAQVKGLSSRVRYLQAGPPAARAHKLVVLIHGGIFSADTWKWVGTLDALALSGLPVVALDLQRYRGPFSSQAVRNHLLKDFLLAIGMSKWPVHQLLLCGPSLPSISPSP